jgi:hypothetical protein
VKAPALTIAIVWLLGAAAGCDRDPQALVMVDASSAQGTLCTVGDGGALDGGFFCEVTNGCDEQLGNLQPVQDQGCEDTTFAPQCGCDHVSYFNSCLRRAAAVSPLSTNEACETVSDLSDLSDPKFFGTLCVPGDPAYACPNQGNVCAYLGITQMPNPLVDFLDRTFDAGISSGPGDFLQQCSDALRAGTTPSAYVKFLSTAGVCWSVPDCNSPADSGLLFTSCSSKCTSACAAIRSGGLVGSCDQDASAD